MKKQTFEDAWNIILENSLRGNKESTLRSYSDTLRYAIKPSFDVLNYLLFIK